MEKILEKIIPGYDYRAKKARLDSDRAVREKLVRELRKSSATMKDVSDLAYRDGKREVVDHIKDYIQAVSLLSAEIENASYGMSPLFRQDGVTDRTIEKMVEFDRNLIEKMEVLAKSSELVYDHVLKGETADIILQTRKIKHELDLLRNVYSDRADFLMKQ
jgi:hypothetical protein